MELQKHVFMETWIHKNVDSWFHGSVIPRIHGSGFMEQQKHMYQYKLYTVYNYMNPEPCTWNHGTIETQLAVCICTNITNMNPEQWNHGNTVVCMCMYQYKLICTNVCTLHESRFMEPQNHENVVSGTCL